MSNDDFNLDLVKVTKDNSGASPRITSVSLCTPGCVTGVLMCPGNTISCNGHCSIHITGWF